MLSREDIKKHKKNGYITFSFTGPKKKIWK